MIRGIFFDVHGTLIDKGGIEGLDNARRKVVNFLNREGYPVSFEEYLSVWNKNIEKHRKNLFTLDEVSFYSWYKSILEDLGIPEREASWITLLNDEYMKGFEPYTKVLPQVREVLPLLKRDYLIGAVS